MKRYVQTRCLLGAMGLLLLLTSVSLFLFAQAQLVGTRKQLQALYRVLEATLDEATLPDLFAQLARIDPGVRLTLLDAQGNVRWDNRTDIRENHADRPEVAQARASGVGEQIRRSETTRQRTLYVAHRMEDGRILRLGYPLAHTLGYLKRLLPALLVICALLLLLTRLLANRFSDRLLEPLLQVQTLLTGKQEETPLQAPFPEVEPLLSSIQYLVRKLYHDLDEVTQTQQVRTDFVANASHELKSPLTSIKGFAELMASGLVASEGKRQEYLQRIVRESDRLLAIINDILHLSQAETTPPGPITTVDLQKIAQEVVQALEILAGQRRITLTVQGKAQAKANARDVWEMLYNLVDNGIRYGREGGVVRVMMQEGTQTVTLRVQDNGMGIRQEHLARIFERFYRVDPSRSRGSGGTGLGLSIVKHLAGKYQGAVEVESQPGEGATFTLRFLKA